MAKMNKCPHCKQEFAKIIKNPYGKFCPHCDIRLFVEGKKLLQNKNITKETLRSIIKSFGYSVGFMFLYILLNITGFYNYFEQHQFTISFAIIFIVIAWEKWYQKKTAIKVVYLHGVDTLADYKNDNCDYQYVKENLQVHQCPNCQSYRMTDLFWFKRRTQKSFNNQEIEEDNFVGCLKCQTAFTTSIKKNKTNQFLWLTLIGFICALIASYFVIKHLLIVANLDIDNNLIAYFLIMWGYMFANLQKRLHDKSPVKVYYQEIS